jgi:hypothetical protein
VDDLLAAVASTMLEWPSISCTIRRSTPAARASAAARDLTRLEAVRAALEELAGTAPEILRLRLAS